MQVHNKIIDKVQKLLRLSKSSNINEASLAAEKAQELIEKYKLDTFQLSESGESNEAIEDSFGSKDWLDSSASPWRRSLAVHLARTNQCVVYIANTHEGKCLSIVGRQSDAQVVRYMYSYLVKEIRRLARDFGEGEGSSYKTAFKRGAVSSIGKRLQEAKKNVADQMRPTHSTALAVVDRRDQEVVSWVQNNLFLGKARQRTVTVDQQGYSDGYYAGKSINIGGNRALGSGPKMIRK